MTRLAPFYGTPEQRFLHYAKVGDGCWDWSGPVRTFGYGQLSLGKNAAGKPRFVVAHKYAYERWVGPVPEGLELDHLCRNTRCARPDHLEPVTHKINLLRGAGIAPRNAAKTHCPGGHAYAGYNVVVRNGGRKCRLCEAATVRASYRRKKGP